MGRGKALVSIGEGVELVARVTCDFFFCKVTPTKHDLVNKWLCCADCCTMSIVNLTPVSMDDRFQRGEYRMKETAPKTSYHKRYMLHM